MNKNFIKSSKNPNFWVQEGKSYHPQNLTIDFLNVFLGFQTLCPGEKVMKLQYCCEWISKIPLHGWQAWKKWLFTLTTFLAPAIFWSIRSQKVGQKVAGAKKVVITKNQFFHAHQLRKGIFEIHSHQCCVFRTFFQSFYRCFSSRNTLFRDLNFR